MTSVVNDFSHLVQYTRSKQTDQTNTTHTNGLLPVPEFIDPVFTKTSPKRSFSLNRKRAFWLVFAKTGSIISGTDLVINLNVGLNSQRYY